MGFHNQMSFMKRHIKERMYVSISQSITTSDFHLFHFSFRLYRRTTNIKELQLKNDSSDEEPKPEKVVECNWEDIRMAALDFRSIDLVFDVESFDGSKGNF